MFIFPESDPSLQIRALAVLLPVFMTIAFYSLYWSVASSNKLKNRIYGGFDQVSANVIHVVMKRSTGFFLLGILPVALTFLLVDNFTLADAGLTLRPETAGFTVLSIILVSALIIPIVSFNSRKPSIYEIYPEIRVTSWNGRYLFAESFTWALYLLGYEALFRGVLLLGLARSLGPVTATIISVILYSAAHLPKNRAETLAAIPFGLVLCIITLYSGSIWIAFLLHLANALTMTLTTIKFNPEMDFAKKGGRSSSF